MCLLLGHVFPNRLENVFISIYAGVEDETGNTKKRHLSFHFIY